jgi:paraquat-inducible protein B
VACEFPAPQIITGQQVVALDFIPNPPPATVTMAGEDFILPTTDGDGVASLETSMTELLSKVNTIPFAQIGKNLDRTLQAVSNITNGPVLQQALANLSGAIKSVDNVVQHLDSDMTPALRRLPEIAADAQKTMANTNRLVISLDNGYGDNTKFNRDLERRFCQLSRQSVEA